MPNIELVACRRNALAVRLGGNTLSLRVQCPGRPVVGLDASNSSDPTLWEFQHAFLEYWDALSSALAHKVQVSVSNGIPP